MKLFNYLKTQRTLVRELNALEFVLEATAQAGHAHMTGNRLLREENKRLEEQQEQYRRIIGGYKAGKTRQLNRAQETT